MRRYLALSAVYFLIFLTLFTPTAYCDGFKIIKVDSHYEPEFRDGPIALPGTNITAGSFPYYDAKSLNIGDKLGFWINDTTLFYVQSETWIGEYDIGGEINYGIYKNYFVADSWSYGAGHNRMMFLFKYDKDSVQLLDVIGQAYVNRYGMDFLSEYDKSAPCDVYRCPPRPMIVKDVDGDGNPEIKLLIVPKHYWIYLEIVNDRMQVNFNPALYQPLFEHAKQKPYKPRIRPFDYYLYGFLAKQLSLEEIRNKLKADKSKKYEWLLALIENYREWNIAFHDIQRNKPELIKYEPTRR